MNTDALDAFVAVATLGSFSRAADSLHLTQPAISKRIMGLEQSLDARLFDRIGRQVVLTEPGRTLLPRAQQLLLDLRDCQRSIAALEGRVTGALSIATSHHIGLHRLPSVLRQYSEAHPAVRLDVNFIESEDAFEWIADGRIEVGIITLPSDSPPGIAMHTVWDDPLMLVVSDHHPLARRQDVRLKDLARHPAVLPSPNTVTRRIIESRFRAARLPLTVSMSTNFLETIRMLVSVGLGWSVLPQGMMQEGLVPLHVPGVSMRRNLGAVFHRERTLSNAARAMLAMLGCNPASSKIRVGEHEPL